MTLEVDCLLIPMYDSKFTFKKKLMNSLTDRDVEKSDHWKYHENCIICSWGENASLFSVRPMAFRMFNKNNIVSSIAVACV